MKAKLKVVYFAPTPSLYGDNIALLNIIPHLISRGVSPYFITNNEGDFSRKLKTYGYDYSIFRFYTNLYPPISSFRNALLFLPRLIKQIISNEMNIKKCMRLINKIKPDIIHTNNSLINAGYIVAKKLNIKHVWHIREYGYLDVRLLRFPNEKLLTKKLNNPNNFSITITNDILRYYDLKRNVKVVYDGVYQALPQVITTTKERYFLFVGRLCETKGIESVIRAFSTFSKTNSGYNLWICGTGQDDYTNKLNHIVKKNRIEAIVKFLGYRTDIYELMSKATALVVASRNEAFGFITAEAMLNNCIVIGRNTAGTKEQFDNGRKLFNKEIGFRYSTNNELKELMQKVANKSYHEIISNARQTATNLYSAEASSTNVFNIYTSILGI